MLLEKVKFAFERLLLSNGDPLKSLVVIVEVVYQTDQIMRKSGFIAAVINQNCKESLIDWVGVPRRKPHRGK